MYLFLTTLSSAYLTAAFLWRGYVLSVIWGMLVMPLFGVAALPVIGAMAVSLIAGLLVPGHWTTASQDTEFDRWAKISTPFLGPLVSLVIAWILTAFI